MYNPIIYYLGKLCPKNHEYNDSGKSLRRKKGGACVECSKEWGKQYKLDNRNKIQQYNNEYDNTHINQRRERYLLRTYGITLQHYYEIYQYYNGCCVICEKPLELFSHQTHIDHDHEDGSIRGILCENCNRGLGMFKDSTNLLLRAINYLKGEYCD